MGILVAFVVVTVLLILFTNTKRWKGIARGARSAKRELEDEIHSSDDD